MSLPQLTIPEPCHERWHEMNTAQKGRYCDSCEKEVYDFTRKSQEEILAIYDEHNGNVCGRFRLTQLQQNTGGAGRFVRRFVLALLVAFGPWLFAFSRTSDGQLLAGLQTEWLANGEGVAESHLGVSVRDKESGLELSEATVELRSTAWDQQHSLVSNAQGDVFFEWAKVATQADAEVFLVVTRNGYQDYQLSLGQLKDLKSKDLLVELTVMEAVTPVPVGESCVGAPLRELEVVEVVLPIHQEVTSGVPIKPPDIMGVIGTAVQIRHTGSSYRKSDGKVDPVAGTKAGYDSRAGRRLGGNPSRYR